MKAQNENCLGQCYGRTLLLKIGCQMGSNAGGSRVYDDLLTGLSRIHSPVIENIMLKQGSFTNYITQFSMFIYHPLANIAYKCTL